jgi:hypothetical protein
LGQSRISIGEVTQNPIAKSMLFCEKNRYQLSQPLLYSLSLSENPIGIEKSEPTLDMRVSTLSPANDGSAWIHRLTSMRTECQMRCGKKSVRFSQITRPVCVEADHGEIYHPSRTQFSTDYVQFANGKRFPRVLLQAVRHTPISRKGCNWAPSHAFGKSALELYDDLLGLDWRRPSVDGAMNKAPLGGESTGKNPTNRAKSGAN